MKINWNRIGIKDLAALVAKELGKNGIDAILVGGACVSVYTNSKYLSYDLDFVSYSLIKEIAPVLSGIGFKKKSSRHFVRKNCRFFIEFVPPPASVGSDPIKDTGELRTKYGRIVLLTPTDSVKDRLAAFYHWNDPQSLEQALMVAKAQKINLKEIKRWSEKEGHKEKFEVFLNRVNKK